MADANNKIGPGPESSKEAVPTVEKPEVTERIKALKPWRDKKAKTLEINPSLILTKAMINNIAIHNPLDKDDIERIKGLKNWQKEEFGEDITAVLRKVK